MSKKDDDYTEVALELGAITAGINDGLKHLLASVDLDNRFGFLFNITSREISHCGCITNLNTNEALDLAAAAKHYLENNSIENTEETENINAKTTAPH